MQFLDESIDNRNIGSVGKYNITTDNYYTYHVNHKNDPKKSFTVGHEDLDYDKVAKSDSIEKLTTNVSDAVHKHIHNQVLNNILDKDTAHDITKKIHGDIKKSDSGSIGAHAHEAYYKHRGM
jgi:tRNA(Ile2) C34 agmatinyltransferase TiaS